MPDKVWIDFETFSFINIKDAGGYAYTHDSSTLVRCLAYAINDEPAELWTPGMNDPTRLLICIRDQETKVYAHNAVFDYRIWNNCCSKDFSWPEINRVQLVDTMALCAAFSLPHSLGEAGAAMRLSMPKNPNGTRLIKALCCPTKGDEVPDAYNTSEYSYLFKELCSYCVQDVKAMRELISLLPRDFLIERERMVWLATEEMNTRGLPIDIQAVKAIKKYLEDYVEVAMLQVEGISEGAFKTINQVAKIKAWCMLQGYPLDNLQAGTITESLADPACPKKVKRILKLRQELGRSSTAKYKKILNQVVEDDGSRAWVKDNLVYCGAGTGRWTGRGFQMHNLPRASVPNPDRLIEDFIHGRTVEDPVSVGKALIRPMVCAPIGYKLIVSDYSSIENRVLAWFAEDQETLDDFKNGVDQYITMASARYDEPYEVIKAGYDAGNHVYESMRYMGKVIILGCGYGMGAATFVKTAKEQFGIEISDEEAAEGINLYREKYHKVKSLWSGLKEAAARAVLTGKRTMYKKVIFGTATVKGTRWLAMKLPSGRAIYYKNPKVEQRLIPKFEYIGPVATVTHEGRNSHTRKWDRLALIPGRITENVVQGFARDIMAQGLLNVQKNMFYISLIGSVHDEALGILNDQWAADSGTLSRFNRCLCQVDFAEGLPLKAKGFIAQRYKK